MDVRSVTGTKQLCIGQYDKFFEELFITNVIIFTILVIPDIIAISDISTTMHCRLRRGGGILKPYDVFLG